MVKRNEKTPHLECSGEMYVAVIHTQNLPRKWETILKMRLKQVWLLCLNMYIW